jgi:DNA modification methylase/Arc/MetJ family transcription regulator
MTAATTTDTSTAYNDFLLSKAPVAVATGFEPPTKPHRSLKPHQVDIATWMIRQGQAAAFASFGLGKTRIQLQVAKWVRQKTGQKVLFIAPLGVRQEFTRNDGPAMGMKVEYCRNDAEIAKARTSFIITNYERVRDGQIDVSQFAAVLMDEASCLRNYGTKTSQMFVQLFADTPYKFLATATPCPNDFIELINYADFLGVMDRGQSMTRWFQRDSEEAGNLTLYPHEEERFWLWVATWGLFVSRPSDLGHDDEGYSLPRLNVHWHPITTSYKRAVEEVDKRNGQRRLIPKTSGGIQQVAKERKHTVDDRIAEAKRIIEQHPDDHWLVWHYLESERHAICKAIPEAVAVYGSQNLEDREQQIIDFSNGKIRVLAPKPEIAGSGCNFQRHCHRAIFVGPTDKFNDFIQAVHRIYRFLQDSPVEVHIVHTDTQSETVTIMKRKWRQHDELTDRMQQIIRTHGLNQSGIEKRLKRMSGVKRQEVTGNNFRAIHNDCVVEMQDFADDSIDQIVTSIPFSDHYEYSPNFNDFGHNNGDVGFFEQFDFLVPQLKRVLKPGRVACIHTKDRIEYGTMTGNAMYSVNEFSDKTVAAFKRHGLIYMGRIVIDTDVVRENAQTYRLGHTENAKDSTKMGCGSTEFVLLFRKWQPSYSPNETANGPDPVTKDKSVYGRGAWQIDASGVCRSKGDELLSPAMIANMSVSSIYAWWRDHCEKNGYDYPTHLQFTEACEAAGKLPASMMLFSPSGHDPNVWTDILRFKTLNSELRKKTTENHICPLQLDVIERLIRRYSNEGETILDPFGGLMSVPYQAIQMGRKGVGIELSEQYWNFGVRFCQRIEREQNTPTLFDWIESQENDASQPKSLARTAE